MPKALEAVQQTFLVEKLDKTFHRGFWNNFVVWDFIFFASTTCCCYLNKPFSKDQKKTLLYLCITVFGKQWDENCLPIWILRVGFPSIVVNFFIHLPTGCCGEHNGRGIRSPLSIFFLLVSSVVNFGALLGNLIVFRIRQSRRQHRVVNFDRNILVREAPRRRGKQRTLNYI